MSYTYRRFEQTYSCGGFASYYGPCGAEDCSSCFPGCGAEQTTNRDLSHGYDFDPDTGKWVTVVCRLRHTARRDHKDGRIKKGQTYIKTTRRYIDDETGESHHTHSKRVVPATTYLPPTVRG